MNRQSAAEFIEAIEAWTKSKKLVDVEIANDTAPTNGPMDDYDFLWQIAFRPRALNKAYLKISVTSDGYPAIGIESWQRMAARLNLQCSRTTGVRFAGGFEPTRRVNSQTLVALCENVSQGLFTITTYQVFSRLVGCVFRMQDTALAAINIRIGPAGIFELRALSALRLAKASELTYAAWSAPEASVK